MPTLSSNIIRLILILLSVSPKTQRSTAFPVVYDLIYISIPDFLQEILNILQRNLILNHPKFLFCFSRYPILLLFSHLITIKGDSKDH